MQGHSSTIVLNLHKLSRIPKNTRLFMLSYSQLEETFGIRIGMKKCPCR
jgi:hypothetical protein